MNRLPLCCAPLQHHWPLPCPVPGAVLVSCALWTEIGRRAPRWGRGLLVLALLLYGARLTGLSLDYVQGYTEVVRNFYSQTRIEDSVDEDGLGPVRSMVHGSITHGEQYLQHPGRATAYYCERTGIVGRTVTVKIKYADFRIVTRSRTLEESVESREVLERTARDLVRSIFPLEKKVRLLGVSLHNLHQREERTVSPQMTLAL